MKTIQIEYLTAAQATIAELTKNRDQWERNSAAENSRAGDALVKLRRTEAEVSSLRNEAARLEIERDVMTRLYNELKGSLKAQLASMEDS